MGQVKAMGTLATGITMQDIPDWEAYEKREGRPAMVMAIQAYRNPIDIPEEQAMATQVAQATAAATPPTKEELEARDQARLDDYRKRLEELKEERRRQDEWNEIRDRERALELAPKRERQPA
jgi:hypothetical protein